MLHRRGALLGFDGVVCHDLDSQRTLRGTISLKKGPILVRILVHGLCNFQTKPEPNFFLFFVLKILSSAHFAND